MQVLQLQICPFGPGHTLNALRVSSAAVYNIIEQFPSSVPTCFCLRDKSLRENMLVLWTCWCFFSDQQNIWRNVEARKALNSTTNLLVGKEKERVNRIEYVSAFSPLRLLICFIKDYGSKHA